MATRPLPSLLRPSLLSAVYVFFSKKKHSVQSPGVESSVRLNLGKSMFFCLLCSTTDVVTIKEDTSLGCMCMKVHILCNSTLWHVWQFHFVACMAMCESILFMVIISLSQLRGIKHCCHCTNCGCVTLSSDTSEFRWNACVVFITTCCGEGYNIIYPDIKSLL